MGRNKSKSYRSKKANHKEYMRQKRANMSEEERGIERQENSHRRSFARHHGHANSVVESYTADETNQFDTDIYESNSQQSEPQNSEVKKFKEEICKGPVFICHSCRKRCYRNQITQVRNEHQYLQYMGNLFDHYVWIHNLTHNNSGLWLCNSCYGCVKRKLQPYALYSNNLDPGDAPPELCKLSPMEIRLVSMVQPFMKMVVLPYGQKGCNGQVIHFPLDVQNIVTQLPRLPAEANILFLKNKSSECSKSYCIQRQSVMDALFYLKENNRHYSNVEICTLENIEDLQNVVYDMDIEGPHSDINCDSDNMQMSNQVDRSEVSNASYSNSCDLQNNEDYNVTIEFEPSQSNLNFQSADGTSFQQNVSVGVFENSFVNCGITEFQTDDSDSSYHDLQNNDDVYVSIESDLNVQCTDGTNFQQNECASASQHEINSSTIVYNAMQCLIWENASIESSDRSVGAHYDCTNCGFTDIQAGELDISLNRPDCKLGGPGCGDVYDDQEVGTGAVIFGKLDETCTINIDNDINCHVQLDFNNCADLSQQLFDESGQGVMETEDDNLFPLHESTVQPVEYLIPSAGNNFEFQVNKSSPLSTFTTKHLESLAFPVLFPLGQNDMDEDRARPLTLLQYIQSRILNVDSRWSSSSPYLFWCLNKYEQEKIQKSINIALKMRNNGSVSVTAGDVREGTSVMPDVIEKSFSYMGSIRGSHTYWYKFKLHCLSILKDRGPPTFFITFSAADMHWNDLAIVLLACTSLEHLKGKKVADLSKSDKQALLVEQPITAARHFDRRFRLFVKHVVVPKEPFGQVTDMLWRVEFQLRGSPHIHSLWWVADAPNLDTAEGLRNAPSFLDKYVTCVLPNKDEEPEMYELVNSRQRHSHTHTCYKSGSRTCRFDFPLPVSDETRIKTHDDPGNPSRMYLLKRPKDSVYINSYNRVVLMNWKGNMDIQLVGSVQGTVSYVCHYICKEESDLLRNAIKQGLASLPRNVTTREKMNKVANVMLSHREVSSQEVAYRLCHLPLRGSSVASIFVSVSRPKDRIRLLKPPDELDELDDDATNIYKTSIFDRYANRPIGEDFENLSLAQFATRYKVIYRQNIGCDDDEDNILEPENLRKQPTFKLQKNCGSIMKRKHPACLRIPQKTPEKDGDDYAYSLLLLYYPWRDESKLLEGYSTARDSLAAKMLDLRLLDQQDNFIEHVMNAMRVVDACRFDPDIVGMTLAPATHEVQPDQAGNVIADDTYDPEGLGNITMFDTSDAVDVPNAAEAMLLPIMSQDEFTASVQSLNYEQRKLFEHIRLHYEKILHLNISGEQMEKPGPLRLFITGGAGCGKSYLISVIYQFLQKIALFQDKPTVILGAYTGVAAFNIGGITLHRALSLTVEHRKSEGYRKLSAEKLYDLQSMWHKVHTFIIDEISMVSYAVFTEIHLRLCEILGNNELFGGLNVLVFGDLFQLPPVVGSMVYNQPKKYDGQLNIWKEYFKTVELVQNMRQQGDAEFADMLNRIRIKSFTDDDIKLLQSRLVTESGGSIDQTEPPFDTAIRVFPKRRQCKDYNDNKITKLALITPVYTVRCTDVRISSKRCNPGSEYALLESHLIPEDDDDCAGLVKELTVAVGARVMLRRNIMTEDGLVNGAMGTIANFDLDENNVPKVILVKFDNPKVGKLTMCDVEGDALVPIHTVSAHYQALQGVMAQRTQFPLTLCWASTVHKMQGTTVSAAVADVGEGIFNPGYGLAYVALSRVRNISCLALTDINEKKFRTKPDALTEMDRLRQNLLDT